MAETNKRNKNLPSAADKKKKLRIIVVTVLAVFTVALLVGAVFLIVNKVTNTVKPIEPTEEETKIIGTSTDGKDTYDIMYDEFRFVTLTYKQIIAKKNGRSIDAWDDEAFAKEHRNELENSVKSNISANCATLAMCKAFNVDPDADDVEEAVRKDMEKLVREDFNGSMKDYKSWLAKEALTDRYLRFSYKMSFLESRLFFTLVDGGIFIDYDTSKREEFIQYVLTSDQYRRTLSILVAEKSDADAIYADLMSKTGDARIKAFNEYIGSSKNLDYGNDTTGHGYYFTKGEMDEKYEAAAFALDKYYEVSQPVESSNGYFIIMRMPIEESYIAVKWKNLLDGYQAAVFNTVTDSYKKSLSFSFNDAGSQYDLTKLK